MKLEMRAEGSTASTAHRERRLNVRLRPSEVQLETCGRTQDLGANQLHQLTEVGSCKPDEVQQGQAQSPARGLGQFQVQIQAGG